MRFAEIDVRDLHAHTSRVLVDVRSPGEFAEGTIPGSVNVPLFTDEERAHIGTVYKQVSPAAARRLAMLTVSPKIPQIIEQMEVLMQRGDIVVYCWRGGMRSYAACTFMDLLKYPVTRLRGGYRAYRQLVMDELAQISGLHSPLVVLHGLTGVGKTRILQLLKERGEQVLDLEAMANHRGSVFGWIGLGKPHNQKTFEALLFEELRNFDPSRPVFMEAESRRIGHSVMPEWLDRDKKAGHHVLITASLEQRVERLMEDYLSYGDEHVQRELSEALHSIKRRMSLVELEEYERLLEHKQYAAFCALLLERYYDPKYKHKLQEYAGEKRVVDANDLDRAVDRLIEIAATLNEQPRTGAPAVKEEGSLA